MCKNRPLVVSLMLCLLTLAASVALGQMQGECMYRDFPDSCTDNDCSGSGLPLPMVHTDACTADGGGWDFTGTKYEGAGHTIDATYPKLRFWEYSNYKEANSGCQDMAHPDVLWYESGLDLGCTGFDHLWYAVQANWFGRGVNGAPELPDYRTVFEFSEDGWFAIATVDKDGPFIEIDQVNNAGGARGNQIPVTVIPPLVEARCVEHQFLTGWWFVDLTLPAEPPSFSDPDFSGKLIDGAGVMFTRGFSPPATVSVNEYTGWACETTVLDDTIPAILDWGQVNRVAIPAPAGGVNIYAGLLVHYADQSGGGTPSDFLGSWTVSQPTEVLPCGGPEPRVEGTKTPDLREAAPGDKVTFLFDFVCGGDTDALDVIITDDFSWASGCFDLTSGSITRVATTNLDGHSFSSGLNGSILTVALDTCPVGAAFELDVAFKVAPGAPPECCNEASIAFTDIFHSNTWQLATTDTAPLDPTQPQRSCFETLISNATLIPELDVASVGTISDPDPPRHIVASTDFTYRVTLPETGGAIDAEQVSLSLVLDATCIELSAFDEADVTVSGSAAAVQWEPGSQTLMVTDMTIPAGSSDVAIDLVDLATQAAAPLGVCCSQAAVSYMANPSDIGPTVVQTDDPDIDVPAPPVADPTCLYVVDAPVNLRREGIAQADCPLSGGAFTPSRGEIFSDGLTPIAQVTLPHEEAGFRPPPGVNPDPENSCLLFYRIYDQFRIAVVPGSQDPLSDLRIETF